KAVSPFADPTNRFRADTRVYSTLIEIEKAPPGLRPGMTAEVDILVTELDNVLSVPVQAVLTFDGKDHVAVNTPDGGIECREVTLGTANETHVEVRQGLESGESIALDPLSLLSEEEKREKKLGPRTTT